MEQIRASNEQLSGTKGCLNSVSLIFSKTVFLSLLSFTPYVFSGSFDSPAAVTDSSSAMFSVDDIYNRLDTGTAGSKRTTTFTEPTVGPATTSHDLNDVMGKAPAVDDSNGATASEVLNNKTFWGLRSDGTWGTTIGSLATQTLNSANDTVSAGNYVGTTLSAVDADLNADNIKSGVTIFGVAGNSNVVNTSTGDATANDLLSGKTAWVAGRSIKGTAHLAAVPKTGQISCYDDATNAPEACVSPEHDGQDALENRGTTISSGDRFTLNVNSGDDNGTGGGIAANGNCDGTETCNGTVTDNLTGLIWLKDASCADLAGTNSSGRANWITARSAAGTLLGDNSMCSLNDGSVAGDWRLPNVRELHSLIDFQNRGPALPSGHPSGSSVGTWTWSSTTYRSSKGNYAWVVDFFDGYLNLAFKVNGYFIWPVRGGK